MKENNVWPFILGTVNSNISTQKRKAESLSVPVSEENNLKSQTLNTFLNQIEKKSSCF